MQKMRLQQTLAGLFDGALSQGVFPGAAVGIGLGEPPLRQLFLSHYGFAARVPSLRPLTADTPFDLASLTKPLATALAVASLVSNGTVGLETRLPELLGQAVPADKKAISLRRLLSHSSGLPAYRRYFERLSSLPAADRRRELVAMVLAEPLIAPPGSSACYSDLGYMLLAEIVARQSGMEFERFVRQRIYEPIELDENLFFLPLDRRDQRRARCAATERCPWRGRVLIGEVSDENAHAVGGVAGQAGLFGTVAAVSELCLLLLDCWQGRAVHPAIDPETLRLFFKRDQEVSDSTWALGFDTPSPAGSSAGRFFSPESIGHLGFTGTSFWIDPGRELAVVLLTNRVHPDRGNELIKSFRPRFHDAVVESLGP